MRLFGQVCSSDLSLPAGTFIYNAVPVTLPSAGPKDALSFIAASSNNTLTLFSLLRSPYTFRVHHTLENVHKSISCLQSSRLNLGLGSSDPSVVTSGRDGRVKFWNVAKFDQGDVLLELRTPNGQGVSAMAQSQSANTVAVGTELENDGPGDVAIYVWKIPTSGSAAERNQLLPILAFTESHTDTITNLSFHVSLPSAHQDTSGQLAQSRIMQLVTSSTDGLINVFDPNQADEDDAVVSVINTRSAVQYLLCINDAAGAFGASGSVCAISQDEKIALFSLASEPEPNSNVNSGQQSWDIREQLHCDYAIDLRFSNASDLKSPAESTVILAVGACKSETTTEPRVDIYVAPREHFGVQPLTEPAIRLMGAHGEEIVRDVWLQEECPIILTCGEDGHVRAWQSSEESQGRVSAEETGQIESKSKKKKKHKSKDHSDVRFKPY